MSIFTRKFPTLIGLLIFGIFTGISIVYLSSSTRTHPQALSAALPQDVALTNLSDTACTVSWFTPVPTVGYVAAAPIHTASRLTFFDDRDQAASEPGNYLTHSVTLTGLTPNTTYRLYLNGQTNNLTQPQVYEYQITTLKPLEELPQSDIAYGYVTTPAGLPVQGSLIYFQWPETVAAAPASSLTDTHGRWALNLSTIRHLDYNRYISYNASTLLQLTAIAGLDQKGAAITPANLTKPVPPIIIGQTVDYRDLSAPDSDLPTLNLPLNAATASGSSDIPYAL